jgi:tetratricopeptide (TPR) repeat protein
MGDYGDMREFTTPDSADLLRAGRGLEALQRVKDQMPAWQLMARIWPGQFREAVAHQLMNMSMALLATHRDSEALAAAEEAVAIYRSLAVARPGKSAPGLATALNNLSYLLRAMGRRDEALAAADESVRIYRSLAAARPQKYRHSLACSPGIRAELLSRAGEREQALDATSEAAQIYQDMRPVHRAAPEAVEVLCLRGQLLCDLSHPAEAAQPLAQAWRLGCPPGRPGTQVRQARAEDHVPGRPRQVPRHLARGNRRGPAGLVHR